jgi:hypothetical protein
MTQTVRAILDTGSSGHDFPTWITKELGCEEIPNPLAHIPINTVLGQYYCQVIATVPILGQISTSENSNFIILAFDVIQNNPSIQTRIELNHTRTKMESVTITFPELHNLQVKFEFDGRTLIASANELINSLRYHIVSINTKNKIGTSPIKSANQSITEFLDRIITGHLIQHPEEAGKLLQDPAVADINFFGRNPDMDPTNAATRLHNHMPITPIKVGSGAGSGIVSNKKAVGEDGSEVGSDIWREVGSEAKAGSAPITGGGQACEDEDYINIETSNITTPKT